MEPGRIYFLANYGGICHLCGSWVQYHHMIIPAQYVGVYQDPEGRYYYLFESAVFMNCKECKAELGSIMIWHDQLLQAIEDQKKKLAE